MGLLSRAVDVSELGQRSLWVIYGKSGSGKTELLSTFPKPLLYLQIGDDGSNTLVNKEGIKAIRINTLEDLRTIARELLTDKVYSTVAIDTFSMVVNEWVDANAVQKKKKLTQQMWGDIKTETEEFVKLFHKLAQSKNVVLTSHEVADALEGFEDEITPDIRPSVSKGARTYLEGMANYGIHTTVLSKEINKADGTTKTVIKFAIHLAQNPYYWTKTQKPKEIKLPKYLIDPSYDKIMALMKGEE